METPTCICFKTIVRGWEEEEERRHGEEVSKSCSGLSTLFKIPENIKKITGFPARDQLCAGYLKYMEIKTAKLDLFPTPFLLTLSSYHK